MRPLEINLLQIPCLTDCSPSSANCHTEADEPVIVYPSGSKDVLLHCLVKSRRGFQPKALKVIVYLEGMDYGLASGMDG